MTEEFFNDISKKIEDLANNTNGPDRYVVRSQAHEILAIGKLDKSVNDLKGSINKLDIATSKLMKVQIWIAVVGILTAVVIAIASQ